MLHTRLKRKKPTATDPLIVVNGRWLRYDRHYAPEYEEETDLLEVTRFGGDIYRTYMPGLTDSILRYQDERGQRHEIRHGVWKMVRRRSGRPYWRADHALQVF